jgi:hypothetical protein
MPWENLMTYFAAPSAPTALKKRAAKVKTKREMTQRRLALSCMTLPLPQFAPSLRADLKGNHLRPKPSFGQA